MGRLAGLKYRWTTLDGLALARVSQGWVKGEGFLITPYGLSPAAMRGSPNLGDLIDLSPLEPAKNSALQQQLLGCLALPDARGFHLERLPLNQLPAPANQAKTLKELFERLQAASLLPGWLSVPARFLNCVFDHPVNTKWRYECAEQRISQKLSEVGVCPLFQRMEVMGSMTLLPEVQVPVGFPVVAVNARPGSNTAAVTQTCTVRETIDEIAKAIDELSKKRVAYRKRLELSYQSQAMFNAFLTMTDSIVAGDSEEQDKALRSRSINSKREAETAATGRLMGDAEILRRMAAKADTRAIEIAGQQIADSATQLRKIILEPTATGKTIAAWCADVHAAGSTDPRDEELADLLCATCEDALRLIVDTDFHDKGLADSLFNVVAKVPEKPFTWTSTQYSSKGVLENVLNYSGKSVGAFRRIPALMVATRALSSCLDIMQIGRRAAAFDASALNTALDETAEALANSIIKGLKAVGDEDAIKAAKVLADKMEVANTPSLEATFRRMRNEYAAKAGAKSPGGTAMGKALGLAGTAFSTLATIYANEEDLSKKQLKDWNFTDWTKEFSTNLSVVTFWASYADFYSSLYGFDKIGAEAAEFRGAVMSGAKNLKLLAKGLGGFAALVGCIQACSEIIDIFQAKGLRGMGTKDWLDVTGKGMTAIGNACIFVDAAFVVLGGSAHPAFALIGGGMLIAGAVVSIYSQAVYGAQVVLPATNHVVLGFLSCMESQLLSTSKDGKHHDPRFDEASTKEMNGLVTALKGYLSELNKIKIYPPQPAYAPPGLIEQTPMEYATSGSHPLPLASNKFYLKLRDVGLEEYTIQLLVYGQPVSAKPPSDKVKK